MILFEALRGGLGADPPDGKGRTNGNRPKGEASKGVPVSERLGNVLETASQIAEQNSRKSITERCLLEAILDEGEGYTDGIMKKLDIDVAGLLHRLRENPPTAEDPS